MQLATARFDLAGIGLEGVSAEQTLAARVRMAKLADGAHQFEAMMLEEMLKPLRFGAAADDAGDPDAAGGAAGTIQGYGSEALARAIAHSGGFGLARQVIREVTREDGLKGAGQHAGTGSKVK